MRTLLAVLGMLTTAYCWLASFGGGAGGWRTASTTAVAPLDGSSDDDNKGEEGRGTWE